MNEPVFREGDVRHPNRPKSQRPDFPPPAPQPRPKPNFDAKRPEVVMV